LKHTPKGYIVVDVNGSAVPLAAPVEAAVHRPPGYSSDKEALRAVSLGLVEEHIGHCVVNAAAEPDPALRAEAIDVKVKRPRMRSAAGCASGNPTHHHTIGLVTPGRPPTRNQP
jgi:hypothetical protein